MAEKKKNVLHKTIHSLKKDNQKKAKSLMVIQSGTPGGIRTPDLLVRSQTLYPAELRAHNHIATLTVYHNRGKSQEKIF